MNPCPPEGPTTQHSDPDTSILSLQSRHDAFWADDLINPVNFALGDPKTLNKTHNMWLSSCFLFSTSKQPATNSQKAPRHPGATRFGSGESPEHGHWAPRRAQGARPRHREEPRRGGAAFPKHPRVPPINMCTTTMGLRALWFLFLASLCPPNSRNWRTFDVPGVLSGSMFKGTIFCQVLSGSMLQRFCQVPSSGPVRFGPFSC